MSSFHQGIELWMSPLVNWPRMDVLRGVSLRFICRASLATDGHYNNSIARMVTLRMPAKSQAVYLGRNPVPSEKTIVWYMME